MTKESATCTSLQVVSTLVVYCQWAWGLGRSALGRSVPLARQD